MCGESACARVIDTPLPHTFTLSWCLEFLVTSEAHDQEKGLSTLEYDVDQGEEKHGSNDLRGKGHL